MGKFEHIGSGLFIINFLGAPTLDSTILENRIYHEGLGMG